MVHRHAANAISIARIPASLALLVAYQPHSMWRLALCVGIASGIAVSDFADGRVARKYRIQSKLGYMLDGLGDRAFHVAVYLVFVVVGLISLLLAWVLILREISQYAVRLVEGDWLSSQSTVDRAITKTYAVTIEILFFVEVGRAIAVPDWKSPAYVAGVNVVLLVIAAASYARILPRLQRAWIGAINE